MFSLDYVKEFQKSQCAGKKIVFLWISLMEYHFWILFLGIVHAWNGILESHFKIKKHFSWCIKKTCYVTSKLLFETDKIFIHIYKCFSFMFTHGTLVSIPTTPSNKSICKADESKAWCSPKKERNWEGRTKPVWGSSSLAEHWREWTDSVIP